MHELKIINKDKKIVYLKWMNIVKVDEVKEVTKKIEELYKIFSNKKYYMIVDCDELMVFPKETLPFIVEQQKVAIKYLLEVADLIPKAITKNQLEKSKEDAGNDKTIGFKSLDSAILYLEGKSIY